MQLGPLMKHNLSKSVPRPRLARIMKMNPPRFWRQLLSYGPYQTACLPSDCRIWSLIVKRKRGVLATSSRETAQWNCWRFFEWSNLISAGKNLYTIKKLRNCLMYPSHSFRLNQPIRCANSRPHISLMIKSENHVPQEVLIASLDLLRGVDRSTTLLQVMVFASRGFSLTKPWDPSPEYQVLKYRSSRK